MGSCADGTCTDPTCSMCVDLPRRFPEVIGCPRSVAGKRCRFVVNHDGQCAASSRDADEPNPTRGGAPRARGAGR